MSLYLKSSKSKGNGDFSGSYLDLTDKPDPTGLSTEQVNNIAKIDKLIAVESHSVSKVVNIDNTNHNSLAEASAGKQIGAYAVIIDSKPFIIEIGQGGMAKDLKSPTGDIGAGIGTTIISDADNDTYRFNGVSWLAIESSAGNNSSFLRNVVLYKDGNTLYYVGTTGEGTFYINRYTDGGTIRTSYSGTGNVPTDIDIIKGFTYN